MDKKLHEDLNRIRKLSGLTEQEQTWTVPLPGGGKRTYRQTYQDEHPQQGDWNEYTMPRTGWGGGADPFGPLDGPVTGRGQQGGSRAAGTPGNSTGAGQQGNNRGQGITGGGPGTNSGPGNSYNGTTGDGQNYTVTPGAGPGGLNRIQRIDPGSTGFSTGPGRGGNTSITIDRPGPGDTEYSPGIPGGSDDSDVEKPLSPRELAKQRAAERAAEVEQRKQDALDRAQAAKDKAQQDALDRNYVNPAWEKEQERLKQQQATPVQPAPEPPKAVAPPTSFQRPSIAKDLILPPLDEPKVAPSTSFKRPELKPTTEPAKEPTPAPATFKRPELKTTSIPEPVKEPTPEPNKSVELPTTFKRPPLKVEPAPAAQPLADLPTIPNSPAPPRPTAKPVEPTPAPKPLADLPTTPNSPAPPRPTAKTAPTPAPAPNKEITSHPVEPKTIVIPTDSKPVDTTTVGSGKTTPVATPAPPTSGPKIDLPVVDLTPTHPDRPTKPDSSTPDAVDLHMVQEPPSKEPGIAQQILLPKNEPAPEPKASITAPIPTPTATPTKTNEPTPGEIVPMSQADQEKIFGPMPGQSSSSAPAPAKKGNNGGGKAGSGSPSSSTAGGSEPGTSGEKGASSSGEPWARPLVLNPGETPRGKFDDPGRVGAPDFKGTLLNPGTLPTPIPGMPDPDLNGRVNPTPNPTPAGSGGKGVTLQPGDDPTDKSEIPDLVIHGPGNKSNEGMERMLQLAGIKESTKVERQFLQESTVNKPNNIADTFKRLAGLK